jgi:hypothetical protein
MDVVAARTFNLLYVYVDIAWLLALAIILIIAKRYLALCFGLAGGLLYFLVDYGIFMLLLGTRTVSGTDPALLLAWLSMSYGFTNFVWIWLWLDKDKRTLEWSLLIIAGWLAVALLAQNFGGGMPIISIARGTSSYHGVMAFIMLVGYAILILSNIRNKDKKERINILWILGIGILVQFAWEAVLLITGIRPTGLLPLIVDSLIETNMGLPYIYLIHRTVIKKFNEDMTRRALV